MNDELVRLLAGYSSFPAIGVGLAAIAGCEPAGLSDPTCPVLGFLVRPDELFTAWLATPSGYHVFELTRTGESLTVSVPWTRVKRVVLGSDNESCTLSVEIDGDRGTLSGEVRDGQFGGFLRPAGYSMSVVPDGDRAQLVAFAGLLRRLAR